MPIGVTLCNVGVRTVSVGGPPVEIKQVVHRRNRAGVEGAVVRQVSVPSGMRIAPGQEVRGSVEMILDGVTIAGFRSGALRGRIVTEEPLPPDVQRLVRLGWLTVESKAPPSPRKAEIYAARLAAKRETANRLRDRGAVPVVEPRRRRRSDSEKSE